MLCTHNGSLRTPVAVGGGGWLLDSLQKRMCYFPLGTHPSHAPTVIRSSSFPEKAVKKNL